MKNIAPDIYRKRFLIEGFYSTTIDGDDVKNFLKQIAQHLELRIYGEPIVFSPSSGMGKEENSGYDAFVPLIDSGISIYIWSKRKFLSLVLYTCKGFDEQKVVSFTKDFLNRLLRFWIKQAGHKARAVSPAAKLRILEDIFTERDGCLDSTDKSFCHGAM